MTPEDLYSSIKEELEFNTNDKFIKIDTDFKGLIYEPGFFPYCNGFFEKPQDHEIPKNCILILGQDWGTVNQYEMRKLKGDGENKNTTFSNLKGLIKDYKWENKIFLSNVFIGLRKEGRSTGENPEILNVDYLQKCKLFLEIQLKKIKPKCVVALGMIPFKFIAQNSDSEIRGIKNYEEHYEKQKEIIHCIFNGIDIKLGVIPHSSYPLKNRDKIDPETKALLKKINRL